MAESHVDVKNSIRTSTSSNSACDINNSSSASDGANRPQLEGREIKNSPFRLIGRCFAAGKFDFSSSFSPHLHPLDLDDDDDDDDNFL